MVENETEIIEMADKRQIKMIHIIKARLKMPDNDYRRHVYECNDCGATSSKDMTTREAQSLLYRLASIAGAAGIRVSINPPAKKYNELHGREDMATPRQLRMIEAMWKDVSFMGTDEGRAKALQAFLTKHFHISDLRFLPQDAVGKVVRTLKAMGSKKKKAA